MKIIKVQLTNDFHNSSVNLYINTEKLLIRDYELWFDISNNQLRRLDEELCGWKGYSYKDSCKCGGIRGEQPEIEIDSKIFVFADIEEAYNWNNTVIGATLYYTEKGKI